MMTDKEMIEEMAKVLHDKIVDKTWRAEKVAEELYKIAVPEGSIVLSEEEHKQMLKDCIESNKVVANTERKRTAEDITCELYHWFRLDDISDYEIITIVKCDIEHKLSTIIMHYGDNENDVIENKIFTDKEKQISADYELPFDNKDECEYWKSRCKEIGDVAYEQARKDTAREFANAMLDIKPDFRLLDGCNPSEFMRSVNLATDIIFQAVKEQAKRYGVEVEE